MISSEGDEMPVTLDPNNPEIRRIDLKPFQLGAVGDISFLRAEWWNDASRFVVIRYAKGKEEIRNGFSWI
jgi:hypothetical protein